jgi:hypothetical protein
MLLPISERLHNRSAGYRYHLVRVWQHLWQVLAVILVPLLLLASISAGTLGMILLVRLWTGVDAFFVRQLFLLLVVTIGLILAVLAYTTSIVVALKKPSGQKRSGSSSSPALLKRSEESLTLVTEPKARELLMLDDGRLATQRSPARAVEL